MSDIPFAPEVVPFTNSKIEGLSREVGGVHIPETFFRLERPRTFGEVFGKEPLPPSDVMAMERLKKEFVLKSVGKDFGFVLSDDLESEWEKLSTAVILLSYGVGNVNLTPDNCVGNFLLKPCLRAVFMDEKVFVPYIVFKKTYNNGSFLVEASTPTSEYGSILLREYWIYSGKSVVVTAKNVIQDPYESVHGAFAGERRKIYLSDLKGIGGKDLFTFKLSGNEIIARDNVMEEDVFHTPLTSLRFSVEKEYNSALFINVRVGENLVLETALSLAYNDGNRLLGLGVALRKKYGNVLWDDGSFKVYVEGDVLKVMKKV